MTGTSFTAKVERVVDGDTVRIFSDDGSSSESLRILALDTEEVNPGTKPVTELGKGASKRAKELIAPGDTIKLILPGNEPVAEARKKYRGNFGRLLCYVELADGTDFQELMIREGWSPYFQKYGYAHFTGRHDRYMAAERDAQTQVRGIWDQIGGNGAVMRNYAALGVWWDLRAQVIENYRRLKHDNPTAEVFNTRLDYGTLVDRARNQQVTTVFIEARDFRPTSGDHVIFSTGSETQPFTLFVPNGNSGGGNDVMQLLLNRYVADGTDNPRRSYAYVTGPTKMFPDNAGGSPELVVTDPSQITDVPPGFGSGVGV